MEPSGIGFNEPRVVDRSIDSFIIFVVWGEKFTTPIDEMEDGKFSGKIILPREEEEGKFSDLRLLPISSHSISFSERLQLLSLQSALMLSRSSSISRRRSSRFMETSTLDRNQEVLIRLSRDFFCFFVTLTEIFSVSGREAWENALSVGLL